MKKFPRSILCLMLLLFFITTGAHASTLYFTSDHLTGGAGTPPFGEVILNQVNSNVNFTVSLYDGSTFVRTGAGDFMDFKFNAKDIVLSDITGASLTAAEGDFDGDGGGYFHYGIYFTGQGTGGADAMSGPINFTVLNSIISDFIGPDVVALNGTGQIFVADILSGQTGFTGLVDVSTAPVPIPGTIVFLGTGLVGIVGLRRKKFFKK